MTNTTRRTKGVHSGARSRRVVESVRAATVAELARVGFGQLTIDGVATAAGVHRATIYRRWPTKQDLVADLMEPQFERLDAALHGSTLREDLSFVLEQLSANLASPEGQAVARVILASDPELADLAAAAQTRARAIVEHAVDRAVDRGEMPADGDHGVFVHVAFHAIAHWALSPPRDDASALLDLLVRAASG